MGNRRGKERLFDDCEIYKAAAGHKDGVLRWMKSGEKLSESRRVRGERGIWKWLYWEPRVRDERDCAAHMDYINFNPVKYGYVTHAAGWAFSSFHRCVRQGLYSTEWAGVDEEVGEWGERG